MLKPETERLWVFLQQQPALAGFVLLGGSALAIHLRHRFSEDLDLAYPAERLPRGRLDALRRLSRAAAFDFQPNDNPTALAQFADSGLELHDYQQDYLVNRTMKVSFFAPEPEVLAVLDKVPPGAGPRLGALGELFRTKCLISARRSRSRDWFDLYVLMTRGGYTLRDFRQAFKTAGLAGQADSALERLCSGQPHAADEGFEPVESGAPSVAQMAQFFRAQRQASERGEAACRCRSTARRRRSPRTIAARDGFRG